VPSLVWSMDYGYRGRQHTIPWMTRLPSEYFVDHVYLSTCSLERVPSPDALARALDVLPELKERIVYTSCAPSVEASTTADVAPRLPESWHQGIFKDNAMRLFRWPTD
jgi:hypothetical protein